MRSCRFCVLSLSDKGAGEERGGAKFTPPTDYSDVGFSLVSLRSSMVFCSIAGHANFVCWLPLCSLGTS